MNQVRPILWMVGVTASGFLLLVLLLGTRRGERKAKLSSKDLGTIEEIKLGNDVLDAQITNVRVLYVVIEEDKFSDTLAENVCRLAEKNDALVEQVRVVKQVSHPLEEKSKARYWLFDDCDCTPIRIK